MHDLTLLASRIYGQPLANVNPAGDQSRWSQAREAVIGGGIFASKKPTLLFNGYADQVAGLYREVDLRTTF